MPKRTSTKRILAQSAANPRGATGSNRNPRGSTASRASSSSTTQNRNSQPNKIAPGNRNSAGGSWTELRQRFLEYCVEPGALIGHSGTRGIVVGHAYPAIIFMPFCAAVFIAFQFT